jgi:hypothetical protein
MWDGKDENGSMVSSGIYISRLKNGGEHCNAENNAHEIVSIDRTFYITQKL